MKYKKVAEGHWTGTLTFLNGMVTVTVKGRSYKEVERLLEGDDNA